MKTKLLEIRNCKQCSNCATKLTKGYGYATDYICKAANGKTIAGYVEWSSEEPQDGRFPDFCPLPTSGDKRPKATKPKDHLDLPVHSVIQDPDNRNVFWTKDRFGVWCATAERSAGTLQNILGKRKPKVLFVPTDETPVRPPKKAED